jgi:hypothetical protein
MLSSRPILVCLPSSDVEFAAHVGAVTAEGGPLREPADLQAILRPAYPLAVVRESELSGLRTPTWYVYRDGHFPWPAPSI